MTRITIEELQARVEANLAANPDHYRIDSVKARLTAALARDLQVREDAQQTADQVARQLRTHEQTKGVRQMQVGMFRCGRGALVGILYELPDSSEYPLRWLVVPSSGDARAWWALSEEQTFTAPCRCCTLPTNFRLEDFVGVSRRTRG